MHHNWFIQDKLSEIGKSQEKAQLKQLKYMRIVLT